MLEYRKMFDFKTKILINAITWYPFKEFCFCMLDANLFHTVIDEETWFILLSRQFTRLQFYLHVNK